VFERFSESTRRTLVLAQEQARQIKHDYVGTEHLLLGIVDRHQCMPDNGKDHGRSQCDTDVIDLPRKTRNSRKSSAAGDFGSRPSLRASATAVRDDVSRRSLPFRGFRVFRGRSPDRFGADAQRCEIGTNWRVRWPV
jgi:ATP-dependent Clp protease ATP-binding subunit ClpA